MGLEPTTPTLATWRSTTELHPPTSWRREAGKRVDSQPCTNHYKRQRGISRALTEGLMTQAEPAGLSVPRQSQAEPGNEGNRAGIQGFSGLRKVVPLTIPVT